MWMSFSALSASRNNSCAITTFATSSLIGVPRKMMRSMRSREKTSYVRSPRLERSMTYGVYRVGIGSSSSVLGLDFIFFHQPFEDFVFGDAALDFLETSALFQLRVKLSGIQSAFFGLL